MKSTNRRAEKQVSKKSAAVETASQSKVETRSGGKTKTTRPKSQTGTQRAAVGFPIVGVGASAGGLEAFTELLKHLPLDTGMAFVLVQHLDPDHPSALTQLLSKATLLPVREVTDDLRVEPNHVYVILPNTNLSIAQGVLQLQPRFKSTGSHHSIDFFFQSLAQDQHQQAVGVILSGTASDGSLGLEAIRAEGGITFAQDQSAKYDSMPRSAIAAGCVDFVLAPEKIARELARIAKHPFVLQGTRAVASANSEGVRQKAEIPSTEEASFPADSSRKILLLLRKHSTVDFSFYKSSTVQRRINRRMVLHKLNTFDAYAQFLQGNVKELDALYSDVLINVTSFFRNAEAFEALKRQVFPKLIQPRRDEPVRVWVLGCSTGQEAYSLAITFTEFCDRIPRAPKLQIFATDLNDALLDKARAGLYAKSAVQDVSPGRLRRFFVEEDGGYRVIKPLRQAVVFAHQNLLSDPPFSRLDLITCRNLLIYVEPDLQKKVMPTFHYALRPNGFLFLGAAESIGRFTELFEAVDKKHKIYSKKPGPSPTLQARLQHSYPGAKKEIDVPSLAGMPQGAPLELNAQREADRVARNRYAPPGVLVNADLQILQFRGDTGPYLKPAAGQASFDLLKMLREGLTLPLRAALNKAKNQNRVVRRENVRVNQNGQARLANLEVVPLKNLKERCYLISFEDAEKIGPGALRPRRPVGKRKASSRHSPELESELAETREHLQSLQEQSEAANEELQASNEEITSANEELQSLNEELETSKEELESTNEELTTVNEEMSNRNADLNRLNSDLTNLQTSTRLPILLLGRDLTIRRFSAQAEKQFNLLATDVGRPIREVRHNLELPDLEEFIAEVINSVREGERELRDKQGRWYSLRVRPYFTLDNKVDGAVLVLVDIDGLKRTEQEIATARDYAANTIETVREPLVVLDAQLRIENANQSFYRTFGVSPEVTVGKSIHDIGNRQWNIPKLLARLKEILPLHKTMENFEVEHEFEEIGHRTMLLNARRIEDATWKTHRILLAIEDITERKQLLQQVQNAHLAEVIIATARDPLLILNANLRVHLANEAFYKTFQASPAETERRLISDLGNGQWRIPQLFELLESILTSHSLFNDFEVTHDFERIGRRVMLLNGRKLAGDNEPERILLGIQDITERKRAEEALRQSETRMRLLVEGSPNAMVMVNDAGAITLVNSQTEKIFGSTRDELVGQPVEMLVPERYRRGHPTLRAGFLQAPTARPMGAGRELFAVRKDGTEVGVEIALNPLQIGERTFVLATITDISKRKQAEQALQLAQAQLADRADKLEQAVAERTAELRASNKQLEAFVYSIAHDLRAPLRAMQGFSSVLVEEVGSALSERGQDFANRINRSAQFMDALLSDLLAFSRISQQRIELASVKLETVVQTTTSRLANEIQERNARVEIRGPWPVVLAHEPTLSQVLINLVSNALKFVPSNVPPLVRLRAEELDQFARLWVEDNGIGIPPEHQNQIFRIFTRLHGEKYPGTGIGLAIVEKGVERMLGRVGLESTPGHGSRFWVELRKA